MAARWRSPDSRGFIVVASSPAPHERAWRESVRDLMENEWADIRGPTGWSEDRLTPQVYQQVISGKPRMSGRVAGLEYFTVPGVQTRVETYADRKQTLLVNLIEAGQSHAYPDALRFVLAVRAAGTRTAAASSSKNAHLFLSRIRLDTSRAEGLAYDFVRPGPHPARFLRRRPLGATSPAASRTRRSS
jgi:hypothetical protein